MARIEKILTGILGLILDLAAGGVSRAADGPSLLWEIGKADGGNREFALAPAGYAGFKEDGLLVIGQSDASRDWPYVHPGPDDAWAGGRQHDFAILFGLKKAPAQGECRLKFRLIDTQAQSPPRLRIRLNEQSIEQALPRGAGDASVNGQPAAGKAHRFEAALSAGALQAGDNEVHITTLGGSWLLYDWIGLEAPEGLELAPVAARTLVDAVQGVRALQETDGKLMQAVRVSLRHFGPEAEASLRVEGAPPLELRLKGGSQALEVRVPAVERETEVKVDLQIGGRSLASRSAALKPVRRLAIYILPHSHTDIGYTEIQTAVEKKQIENLVKGIEYARRTADYPPGAQFKWNVEVLWAADSYLREKPAADRAAFFEAVKKGWVGLNGMYLNELTGLCRPEELLRLFRYSTRLAEQCGAPIDSAMISDVPGYTWGSVAAMAHAGIKYFSTAPNYFDRIGDILLQWENKPFYWIAPSGREKVLVWIPYRGYAMSHIIHRLTPEFVEDYQAQLERAGYPYDIAYMRWSGHGDNAEPDPAISEFVKEWNPRYAWPKFIIATTGEAFRTFEARYGEKLPRVRGDWTPYWEDGAGSSALETAMNRASSDRLVQAEALWALLDPAGYPASAFEEAWRHVLLYSEHTWGAWCSVSDPENSMTREQWEIKRSYAMQADRQSRDLLRRALEKASGPAGAAAAAVEVWNTCSWPRTDLVLLSKDLSAAGDRVVDGQGRPAPSQRLWSGELAFLAREVPALGSRRYSIAAGAAPAEGRAGGSGAVLDNGLVRVRIDEKSGGIIELAAKDLEGNFADPASGQALNEYLFLPGDDLKDLQKNGPVRITAKERGGLVASLFIESEAPGCNRLSREVRLIDDLDRVEIVNVLDKKRAPSNPKPGDWSFAQKGGKESVNFAFPFNVPGGEMRLDLPFAVIRPEADQMPSACKNWLVAGRWADVSSRDRGITWVTLDAPLVQVGGLTATLLGSQANPEVWRKRLEPTSKLYSWAMNNHWGTNYRAYQDGLVTFRFALRPHRRYDPVEAARLAIGLSQPLLAAPAGGSAPAAAAPRLRVEPDDVLVTALKPSDDGKAWIVRLFGASGEDREANLSWSSPAPSRITLSDLSEKPGREAGGKVPVPGWSVVTVRAERP